MKNKYKIPWHVRQYVKKELLDYKANKKLLKNYKGDTRGLLIASTRICQIEKVLNGLNTEDKEIAELIFLEHYTQAKAETTEHIPKSLYYTIMSKVIYLTAIEMELI